MSAKSLYLDYNCFQRGFDDHAQTKIQMEALACQEIFSRAEKKLIQLAWSFIHVDETVVCPFLDRKHEAFRLSTLCKIRIGPKEEIRRLALSYQEREKTSAKDALHLACASIAKIKIFVTCDGRLLKQARRLEPEMQILDPVDYVRLEEE